MHYIHDGNIDLPFAGAHSRRHKATNNPLDAVSRQGDPRGNCPAAHSIPEVSDCLGGAVGVIIARHSFEAVLASTRTSKS